MTSESIRVFLTGVAKLQHSVKRSVKIPDPDGSEQPALRFTLKGEPAERTAQGYADLMRNQDDDVGVKYPTEVATDHIDGPVYNPSAKLRPSHLSALYMQLATSDGVQFDTETPTVQVPNLAPELVPVIQDVAPVDPTTPAAETNGHTTRKPRKGKPARLAGIPD